MGYVTLTKLNSEEKIPFDLRFYSRTAAARVENLDHSQINQGKNKWFNVVCSQQEQVSLELKVTIPPEHPPFVAISDSYLEKIQLGKILPKKGSVVQIDQDTLILEDKTSFKVDAIVFCTGYRAEIPFLEPSDQKLLGFKADDSFPQPSLMYKTIPSRLSYHGIYRYVPETFWRNRNVVSNGLHHLQQKNPFPSNEGND